MTEVDPTHFSYGAVTPVLAYLVSVVGSFLGLMCTSRSRTRAGGYRYAWLLAGALSIGYTGIWAMHFIAMLGFGVPGVSLRYDPALTALSAVIAIGVVGLGLLVATSLRGVIGLLLGGTVAGLGVAAMHYMGMASLDLHGHISHETGTVIASIVIAVAAATAALWAALTIDSLWGKVGAALIMGFAVCTMHYTAMAGVRVSEVPAVPETGDGLSAVDFLFPLVVILGTFTSLLALLILLSPSEQDVEDEEHARARLERIAQRNQRSAFVPYSPALPGSAVLVCPPRAEDERAEDGEVDDVAGRPHRAELRELHPVVRTLESGLCASADEDQRRGEGTRHGRER
jgi:NO-binding membrane sensor protein with MHYT domain